MGGEGLDPVAGTGTVTATVPVDNFTPGPSATSPNGRYLYVPNHNTAMSGANQNVVDVIDTASRKLIGDIAVPANPHWVVFDKNGRFYTTDHMSAKVTVLNAQNNAIIAEIEVGGAANDNEAKAIARRIATSPLVKTALFGRDANWGRILAAAGSAPSRKAGLAPSPSPSRVASSRSHTGASATTRCTGRSVVASHSAR